MWQPLNAVCAPGGEFANQWKDEVDVATASDTGTSVSPSFARSPGAVKPCHCSQAIAPLLGLSPSLALSHIIAAPLPQGQ